jgi:hypothetical protein
VLAHYRIAIVLDPDYIDAYWNLGIELYERGYRKAISLNPRLAVSHSNLG